MVKDCPRRKAGSSDTKTPASSSKPLEKSAASAAPSKQAFKGKCFACGRVGHRVSDCPRIATFENLGALEQAHPVDLSEWLDEEEEHGLRPLWQDPAVDFWRVWPLVAD